MMKNLLLTGMVSVLILSLTGCVSTPHDRSDRARGYQKNSYPANYDPKKHDHQQRKQWDKANQTGQYDPRNKYDQRKAKWRNKNERNNADNRDSNNGRDHQGHDNGRRD